MIMCVLLCYPVSIRIYYQQGGLFLVNLLLLCLCPHSWTERPGQWTKSVMGKSALIPLIANVINKIFSHDCQDYHDSSELAKHVMVLGSGDHLRYPSAYPANLTS